MPYGSASGGPSSCSGSARNHGSTASPHVWDELGWSESGAWALRVPGCAGALRALRRCGATARRHQQLVAVVAVGAGTLNDLAKRACGELGRPYAVVGTAASMDGYTAGTSRVGRRPSRRPAPALPGNKSLTRANGMGDSVPRNHRV